MRRVAAAKSDVADPDAISLARILRAFVAIAGEWIERSRERPIAGNASARAVGERLKRRLGCGCPVRHRERCHVTGKGLSYLLYHRHQRLRAALAVEPDHIGAGRFQALARIDHVHAIEHFFATMYRQGDDGGQTGRFHDVESNRGFAIPIDRFRDEKVGTLLYSPTDLLLEHGPDGYVWPGGVRLVGISVANIAGHQAAKSIGDVLRDTQRLAIDQLQNVL